MDAPTPPPVPEAQVGLHRDLFLRSLLRELSGTLEDVVGLDEASGFVAVVGQRIGDAIDRDYRQALGTERFTPEQVAAVLVDLKRRIQGEFVLESQDAGRMVFRNSACPFGDKVLGRRSLCMMTSNVFGVISAEHLGQAKVELQQTIAAGDGRCRVVVHLRDDAVSRAAEGREYFRSR